MKRILIDGRFVGIGDSISRYTLELLEHILKIDHTNSYTLLIRPQGVKKAEEYFGKKDFKLLETIDTASKAPETEHPNLSIEVLDVPHYSLSEQTRLLSYLNRKKYDLVHFAQFNHPVRYKGNFVVTIHDLILLHHTKSNPIKQLAFAPVMKSAVKNSSRIITVSDLTLDDVVKTYGVKADKISRIYHGIDHQTFNLMAKNRREQLDAFRRIHKVEHDYLVYVGAWKVHKNILRLLQAYEKYLAANNRFVHLVLVGKADKREKQVVSEIDRINKEARKQHDNVAVIVSDSISSDEELAAIYAGALAYVMPSTAEGFGWPPLEAMACGTPVISSKLSCMPEILGEAALYFDPLSVDDIVKSISQIVDDHKLREGLIKKGLEQARKYDWEETAKKTLEVYNQALEK